MPAMTLKKRGQFPFLYFDYLSTEKSERWKKGDCPLFFNLLDALF
jgi:hypothetical protein